MINNIKIAEKTHIFLIALSMAGVLLLDFQTPLGIADAVLYALPVFATMWLKGRQSTYILGAMSVVFVILGYYYSPSAISPPYAVFINRGYAILLILVGIVFTLNFKNKNYLLLQKGKLLETVMSDSFDALIKINEKGKVIGWNKSSESIFGWSSQEALDKDISELIIPPQFHEAHKNGIHRFLTLGHRGIINQHIEISALKKCGSEFPVELTVSAIQFEGTYVFTAVVRDITQRKKLEIENQSYALQLADKLKKETLQLQAMEIANATLSGFSKQVEQNLIELKNAYLQTMNCLSLAAEFKDEETGKHLLRISKYSKVLANAVGLSAEEADFIVLASPMHDIGKVGIPDIILQKNGKLTDSEFNVIKQHTYIGAEILGNSSSNIIKLAKDIALSHHEKWNGCGYPNGIAGEDIPIAARIVALVDCFDALTSARPYKNPYPIEMAFDIIVKEKGKSFEPFLVSLFVEKFDEFKQIAIDNMEKGTPNTEPFQLSGRDHGEEIDEKA